MATRKTKETAKATKTAPANAEDRKLRTIRVAQVESKKTGRTILIRPQASGSFAASDQAQYGIKSVDEWVEVEASGWADATAQVKAGKGKKVRAAKVEKAAAASSRPRKKPAAKKAPAKRSAK